MVLCFDDPNTKRPLPRHGLYLPPVRQNNIPYASNIATAEMLVLGLAGATWIGARWSIPKATPSPLDISRLMG